ncbi:MAG: FKBP-type peptidyl-prolyl cis-trans isomerase, partial [Fibrobacter sp.]|nr:FKBP-type peptidyl-prolyl cis-trans isomerase [Fibrobacter sp.]
APKIPDEQILELQRNFSIELQKKNQESQRAAGEKNLNEGKLFLENNKNNPGVKTTASGLQYIVIKEGKGAHPKATDNVKVHYRGTLLDGKEFDSSYRRGEPAVLALNQVIPGWTEGIQLMTPGSNYKFFIPAELAYGDRQAGPDILPNSTLIFDVELISIEK